ncbi:MAG: tetratricopeptide repeat protein [Planctomycetia bacterium]
MPMPMLPIDVALDHHLAGRRDEAERIYREILDADPDDRDALHLLGVAAYQAGRHDEALGLIQLAIAADGSHATFHNSLGAVYQALGDLPRAVSAYQTSILLDMDYADAHGNLGLVLRELGRAAESAESLRRALQLKPGNPNLLNSLGITLRSLGRIAEAADCYRGALVSREAFWEPHSNLGNILKDECRTAEAIAHYRRAIELAPQVPLITSNLLCALHYRDGITAGELAAAHDEFEKSFGEPLRSAWKPHDNDRDLDRPLRLGFLSPDLHRHPVGYFLVGLVEHLDHAQASVFCYSTGGTPDDLSARLRAAATEWRDVGPLTDEAIAESIRDDSIDILFDLAGHTGNNRLLVMGHKPAPVQVTWAGYVGTAGLAAIDYLLADRFEVPPELEHHYREKVLRMPAAYVCYEPPATPPVAPLPAFERGHVTFGSFSNPAKLGPQIAAPWARILDRVPNSRLVLKYRGLDDPLHARRLRGYFAAQGIDPARVDVQGDSRQPELLPHYDRLDIALDPFPYGGGVTTLEALWMGVPVVTLPGETFASRHALTHLSNVGIEGTIARDLDHYVDLAVALAAALPALAAIRAGLRERMAASPLCDGERFASDFLRVMRGAWREWASDASCGGLTAGQGVSL